MRKKEQGKIGRQCNAYKVHNIDLAEKVEFQHPFKNVNGRCFSIFCRRLSHILGPR